MITHYVGIDISLKTASVAWQTHPDADATVIDIEQNTSGYGKLLTHLSRLTSPDNIHVVMEATSTYWMTLAHILFEAGFHVSVVNPSQPKHFAQMQLRRAKTDKLDAILLMHYARSQQPDPWMPPPPICEILRQHLTYRDQLINIQAQVRSQLHAFEHNPHAHPDILARMKQHLTDLTAEIEQLKNDVQTLLLSTHDWAQPTHRLLSIPGIGPISAAWLLVATHCFARCLTPQQAAAFAGLAPHPKDSGSSKRGHRSVGGGGHQALRNALYMASAPASRFNPLLKPYYEHLLARGKPKKVARCAVARKLIHIAWTCVTNDVDFDPSYRKVTRAA